MIMYMLLSALNSRTNDLERLLERTPILARQDSPINT